MTHYTKVPERVLQHIPAKLPFEVAALTEPCCVAYNATCGNARLLPGDAVAVIGPGPIGLLCAAMAKIAGAGEIVVIGTSRGCASIEGRRADRRVCDPRR